jgi:4-hydroxybenzoyl-CoA thioesterase
MPAFIQDVTIRFAHTDAAGIAFYPKYFELINNMIEDWFEALGFDFRHLHIDEKRAVPTVHIEADFLAASQMHDVLKFSLSVDRIGSSSVHLRIGADCASESRFRMRFVVAHMDMKTGASLPWPNEMRTAMMQWLTEETATEEGTL